MALFALTRQSALPCAAGSSRLFSASAIFASPPVNRTYSPNPEYQEMFGLNEKPKFVRREGHAIDNSPEGRWREMSRISYEALRQNAAPTAYTGRRVQVHGGNLLKAFRDLGTIIRENNIREEMSAVARYEKPGKKRRRLKSETWRRVFAHEVRRCVQLVAKIQRRGE
ncbi:hypothetical protein CYLTODRAFT_401191 [Cylindrobasidium torrendii FP15055 ss-10]|uniref:Ribosomal protein S21 n=1 Tax=Cylindrobasidium torrendii FP15055 ss-10 TaxID=1314674 RepID=A0A0D7B367_9AGAR|nr:hypothetical protein CYLTODRAFT_401191 [Cylindrobasidium torrendii FP15055 ss-10]